MTKTITKNSEIYHICSECDFAYEDKATAMKCENWCKEHHSCNLEITKHAINI